MDDPGGPLCRILSVISASAEASTDSTSTLWINILVIFILILINGFFAASEMAIVTLNDNRVRKEAAEGNQVAKKLLRFVENQGSFLATIQVSITLAGFLSSAFGADKLSPLLYNVLNPAGDIPALRVVSTILITLIIAYFSLVLGELVPKRIALSNPERFARSFVGILTFFDKLFKPFAKFLNVSTNLVSKLLRIEDNGDADKVTEEEIRLLTEVGRESGVIESDEAYMINNIFELNDKEVCEIMTPRTAMVALAADSTYDEVIDVAANERYSRIPVYGEDLDDILGVLHIKDLLRIKPADRENFKLEDHMRATYFVPESKSINVLIQEMQQHNVSLAIVVDEYGGTDGLIAIEDILEEIVGEIDDEYDERPDDVEKLDDGSYILNGLLTPEDSSHYVPELAAIEEDDDYDTLAGFVLSLLERIPKPDEHPSVDFGHLRFTVLEMDDRRISKIKLEIIEERVEGEEDNENE